MREGWRKLGRSTRRGATLPPIGPVKRHLQLIYAAVGAGHRGDIDPETMSVEELAETLTELAADLGIMDAA